MTSFPEGERLDEAGSVPMVRHEREIDRHDRPRPVEGLVTVPLGGEAVVLDGWREAAVLSPAGVQVWNRLDGTATLASIAETLAETFDVDFEIVLTDVVGLTRQLADLGLIEGVDPDDRPVPDITLVPAHVTSEAGERIDDLDVVDVSGNRTWLLPTSGHQCILVNWSPHCGYCTSILARLARLDGPLADAGVPLVLFAYGSAEASGTLAELTGWHPRVLLKPPHELGPFVGHGTPAAFHLDGNGTLLSPAARGADEVLRLAATLAGVDFGDEEKEPPSGAARYLLDRGGSCGPGSGSEPIARWAGTRVYRIGGYHVGLRYASTATARVLDELLIHETVDDPNAGHVFTVALGVESDAVADREGPAAESQLVLGSQLLVRSRFPERVVRALLWRLDDQIDMSDLPNGHVRVTATAVLTPVGAVLLQPGLYGLEERLQPAFARHGIAFVDVVNPEIDLVTAELVVPEPGISHDINVIEKLRSAGAHGQGEPEPEPVRPGRYPLVGWGTIHEAEVAVTPFSPAQAAAAVLSFVLDTDDQVKRVRELGELFFERISGFGLWYHSESQLADAVAEAVGLT